MRATEQSGLPQPLAQGRIQAETDSNHDVNILQHQSCREDHVSKQSRYEGTGGRGRTCRVTNCYRGRECLREDTGVSSLRNF